MAQWGRGEGPSHAMWTRFVRLGTTLGLRYDLGLVVLSNWCSYDERMTRYIVVLRPRGAGSRVVARLGGRFVPRMTPENELSRAVALKYRTLPRFASIMLGR